MTIQECLRSGHDFGRPGQERVFYATVTYIDCRGVHEGHSPLPEDILADDWFIIRPLSAEDLYLAGINAGFTRAFIRKLNQELGLE